ncbi:MAG: catalase family peroxidase [Rhodanobacteraceae bacterium]
MRTRVSRKQAIRISLSMAIVLSIAIPVAFAADKSPAPRQQPTAMQIVNQFQKNDGVFLGYRRNHAKGVCIAGYFVGSGKATRYSTAQVFVAGQRTPVMGRLSIPGTNPYSWDDFTPIRGMALAFTQANGQQWRSAMNAVPAFPVASAAADFAFMKLQQPDPATGEPNPEKLAAFFASHPSANRFRLWIQDTPPSASYATRTYNSLDAFEFVNASGQKHAVRWSMVPKNAIGDTKIPPDDPNFLAQDLRRRLAKGPLKWRLVVTLANPGDPTDNASIVWKGKHREIDAGTLVIDSTQPQATGPCHNTNFDPTVLPTGIALSDDPLLKLRHEAYAISHDREVREVEAQESARGNGAVSPQPLDDKP